MYKKEYSIAEIEIVMFEKIDVVVASLVGPEGEGPYEGDIMKTNLLD